MRPNIITMLNGAWGPFGRHQLIAIDTSLTLSILCKSITLMPFHCRALAHFDTFAISRGQAPETRAANPKHRGYENIWKFENAPLRENLMVEIPGPFPNPI